MSQTRDACRVGNWEWWFLCYNEWRPTGAAAESGRRSPAFRLQCDSILVPPEEGAAQYGYRRRGRCPMGG